MEFIRTYTADKGYAPASVANCNMRILRTAGIVAFEDGKARTVRVIETYPKAERGGVAANPLQSSAAARPQGGQE